jgi:hypothetical protein
MGVDTFHRKQRDDVNAENKSGGPEAVAQLADRNRHPRNRAMPSYLPS